MSGAAAPRLIYGQSPLIRHYSTLEIEVEYISTSQPPPPERQSTEHDPNKFGTQYQGAPGQRYSLNSLSEDEEDSGAGVQAPAHYHHHHQQQQQQQQQQPGPPPIRHSTRPNVASLRRVARPLSDQSTQQSLTSYHLMDDPFARMYTPSLPPIPQSTTLDSVPLQEEKDQAQGQEEKEKAGEKKEEEAVAAVVVEEEEEKVIEEEETRDRDVGTGSIDPTSSSNVELFSVGTSSNGQSVAHSLLGYHAQHSYHRQEEQDQYQHEHDPQQHPQLQSTQAAASFQTSRSPLLPSSHITHDETPGLSSTGSQSDDEDEEEVLDDMQVPIDCLELAEGDDSDGYDEGRSISDILGPPMRRATSVGGGAGNVGSRKTSVRSSSVKSASGRSASGQSASGQSTSDKSTSGQSTGGNSVGGQSAGGQSANGQSVNGQSVGGQSAGGQSANGQSTNGTSSHDDNASGRSSLRRRTHGGSTGASRMSNGRRRENSISPTQEGQEAPEMETQETLKRERTRILERTVVNSYRTIEFRDVTNIRPLKRGGYGEIHVAEWSRLRVVLKRALPDHAEGMEQFDQEVRCSPPSETKGGG